MTFGDIGYLLIVLTSVFFQGQGTCPGNCKGGKTCNDADSGCPECKQEYYGRQCEFRTECRYTNLGQEYRGKRNTTKSGLTCQRWDTQKPHSHKKNEEENYCRNPDRDSVGPWCYTVDPKTRYQSCGIPMCNTQCPRLTLYLYGDVINPPTGGFALDFTVEDVSGGCGIGKRGNRTCQKDLKWSSAFDCKDIPWCSKPVLTDPNSINATKTDYYFNESVNLCRDGFEIIGSTGITCQADKTWTKTPCTRVKCHKPVLNGNSVIRDADKRQTYVYEDGITVECISGYETNQQASFKCQANRNWNGPMPKCNAVHCENPVLNENNIILHRKSTYVYLDTVNITCGDGYNLVGERLFMCRANKTWSGAFPTCKPVSCEKPDLPQKSRTTLSNTSFVFMDTVNIECMRGFSVKTNSVITCLANMTWGTIPECTIVVCNTPQLPAKVFIIKGENTTYLHRHELTLECQEGHTYEGSGITTCLYTGLWEESYSNCVWFDANVTANVVSEREEGRKDPKYWLIFVLSLIVFLSDLVDPTRATSSIVGAAIGGTFGVLVLVTIAGGIVFIYTRRRRKQNDQFSAIFEPKVDAEVKDDNATYEHEVDAEVKDDSATYEHEVDAEAEDENYLVPAIGISNIYNEMANNTSGASNTDTVVQIAEFSEYFSSKMAEETFFEKAFSALHPRKSLVIHRRENLRKEKLFMKRDEEALTSKDCFIYKYQRLESGVQGTFDEAMKPKNKCKNKYRGIYPYDHNRIKLTKIQGDPESDFINASPIEGYGGNVKFVAAQGPLKTTITDFWRMVWEIKCDVIVMLTNVFEEGKHKCEQYWPEEGSIKKDGITIKHQCTDVYAEFAVRQLTMSKDGLGRHIHQCHYTVWPDKSVPKYVSSLAQFHRKVLDIPSRTNGPIIVHCSAGIGRTGTFIALDLLVNEAKVEGSVDVFSCLTNLRKQRVGMVQTNEQYEFLHRVLLESYECQTCTISSLNFDSKLEQLRVVNSETRRQYLHEQYQTLENTSPVLLQEEFVTGKSPENRNKNRHNNILPETGARVLPIDCYMPLLTEDSERTGSYINAVYIPGYRYKNALIATQMPLPNTVVDFLTLVYQQNITTIVMLNQTNDQSCGIYWPENEGTDREFGPFKVSFVSEEAVRNYILRTLKIKKGSDKSRTLRQYRVTDWPDNALVPTSPSSLLNVIEAVKESQRRKQETVIVHCMNGADKSGLFCFAMVTMDRLKEEHNVVVQQIIKQIRSRRPHFIPNMEQFQYCFEFVSCYFQSFETYECPI